MPHTFPTLEDVWSPVQVFGWHSKIFQWPPEHVSAAPRNSFEKNMNEQNLKVPTAVQLHRGLVSTAPVLSFFSPFFFFFYSFSFFFQFIFLPSFLFHFPSFFHHFSYHYLFCLHKPFLYHSRINQNYRI